MFRKFKLFIAIGCSDYSSASILYSRADKYSTLHSCLVRHCWLNLVFASEPRTQYVNLSQHYNGSTSECEMKPVCQLRLFVEFLILFLASRHKFDMLITNQGYLFAFIMTQSSFIMKSIKRCWLL